MADQTDGGALALAWATTKLGFPYIYGGIGPVGYDCSGLTMMAYESVGLNISRTTYTQYKIAPVNGAWQAGDLGFVLGSDPGAYGQPGHVGIFVCWGTIIDYHHCREEASGGGMVFLNAPYSGDPGGIRYDYFQVDPILDIVAHTRPAELLPPAPKPKPVPPLPGPTRIAPTAAQLKKTRLVLMEDIAQAEEATANGWNLWYFATNRKFEPQVDGKPTGVNLYANKGWAHKRTAA